MNKAEISDAGRKVISNLRAGLAADDHISGRSSYGGFGRTIMTLRNRGLIDRDCKLTEAGQKWAEENC